MNPELVRQKIEREVERGPNRRSLAVQLRALAASDEAVPVGAITSPALVVAGEHDALIPSCYARQLAEAIPDSRLLLVANAGHNPLAERPDVVVPAISRFLSDGTIDETAAPHRLDSVRSAG
jgi:pimeloyl-ACP methyl ester carboxylesterase